MFDADEQLERRLFLSLRGLVGVTAPPRQWNASLPAFAPVRYQYGVELSQIAASLPLGPVTAAELGILVNRDPLMGLQVLFP